MAVNPYAANPGDVVKHLVLAELLHGERSRLTTYIDTHAGRPWNDLSKRAFLFSHADRQPPVAWADGYMERAVGGELGEDIKQARYTTILKTDHGAGTFWGRNGLASPPVYPGSVGIALASNLGVTRWFCGEVNGRDRARLRAALPPRSVFTSLLSPWGRARVDAATGPHACILVDPWDLPDTTLEESRKAHAFITDVAAQGAVVEAWYPLNRPETPAAMEELLQSLDAGTKLEVWWSHGTGPSLRGAGVIVANAGGETTQRLTTLVSALTPLYQRVAEFERVIGGSPTLT